MKSTTVTALKAALVLSIGPTTPACQRYRRSRTKVSTCSPLAVFPLSDKLDLFGKAGFVSWTTEVEESEELEFSSSSTDLALGLGGEYDLNTRFSLRGEYLWIDSDNSGAGDTLSLAGVFHFQ